MSTTAFGEIVRQPVAQGFADADMLTSSKRTILERTLTNTEEVPA